MKTVNVNYSYVYTTVSNHIGCVSFEARSLVEALEVIKALKTRIPIKYGAIQNDQRRISVKHVKPDAVIYLTGAVSTKAAA